MFMLTTDERQVRDLQRELRGVRDVLEREVPPALNRTVENTRQDIVDRMDADLPGVRKSDIHSATKTTKASPSDWSGQVELSGPRVPVADLDVRLGTQTELEEIASPRQSAWLFYNIYKPCKIISRRRCIVVHPARSLDNDCLIVPVALRYAVYRRKYVRGNVLNDRGSHSGTLGLVNRFMGIRGIRSTPRPSNILSKSLSNRLVFSRVMLRSIDVFSSRIWKRDGPRISTSFSPREPDILLNMP